MTPTKAAPEGDTHSIFTTVIIAMLAMLGPFTIDTIFPAFTKIGLEFGVNTAALQQLTSSYLVSFAAMSLFHGPISDAVGRKPVIIIGTLIFAGASAGCALATSFEMLVAFRVLEGLAAGAGQIISRTLIRDLYSGVRAQKLMAQVSMIFGVAPAIAPVIGGWILGFSNWRAVFWFLAGYGLLMVVAVLVLLPETNPAANRVPLNVRSLLGGMWEVAKEPRFARLAGTSSFGFGAQFVYIGGAPIFVVNLLGKGEHDFWILFVPLMVGLISGSWLSSRLAGRFARRRIVAMGYTIALGAAAANVLVSALPGAPTLPWAVLGPMVLAFGVSISFPVMQLEMLDLFPRHRGSAASLQAFVMLVVNAIITGVVVVAVGGSALGMALASLGFSALAVLIWTWHSRVTPAEKAAAEKVSG